jgi:hypothetical protein
MNCQKTLFPYLRIWTLGSSTASGTHLGTGTLSAELDYERLRRELPRGVEPAYDGMVIGIPLDG